MITLGINAAFHDCAAALVDRGVVIAAAEEERFTHVKHGKRPLPFSAWQLPFHAIDYCLKEVGIELRDVDQFAYSFNPLLFAAAAGAPRSPTLDDAVWTPSTDPDNRLPGFVEVPLELSRRAIATSTASPWDPLFLTHVVNAPRQLASGVPHHLQSRFRGVTEGHVLERWHFVEHHLSHEASAFLAAPFEECAALTLDGRGERATTSAGIYQQGTYRRLRQVDVPDSLGLLYEDFTRHLGFLHSSDEYKVMALASFGRPTFLAALRKRVSVDGNGGYTTRRGDLEQEFGPARKRGEELEQRHYDIASSLQAVLEETVVELAIWLRERTRANNLVMAGGVALNCVMNARIRDEAGYERVWVQPAAGDAGTALGAALWMDHEPRVRRLHASPRRWAMTHAYLGPAFDDAEVERFLEWTKAPYERVADVAEAAAELLAQDQVIGWYQGRMEFGPRALGARSILASPLHADMQSRLNDIKDREDFRPVAPVVLEERASEWFIRRRPAHRQVVNGPPTTDTDEGWPAPYMLFIFDVRPEKAALIPAVRHVDGTARVQTVNRSQHPLYHDLLSAFERRTGVPVLVNTSFNTRGEPIVCTPRDAVESFWTSPLDALFIGSFLLRKCAQAQNR